MSAAYFDSSVALSFLLNDTNSERARSLWERCSDRISSVLFEIECWTVIRRVGKNVTARLGRLDEALEEIEIQYLHPQLPELIRANPGLAKGRTLDVIHLASAMSIQAQLREPIFFCTFDDKLAALAKQVGLKLQ